MNIFQQLASDSESDDFGDIIDEPKKIQNIANATPFSTTISSNPTQEKNIFETLNEEKEDKKFGFLDTARDIGEQIISKGISGFAGGYGNLLDTFGLQAKEGQTLPIQEEISAFKAKILDKMNRGEAPTFSELMFLSDDEGLPPIARLPTSKEIQGGIENITDIGEGKTPAGRIAGRGAEFLGEGAATGGGAKALIGLAASGLVGQGIRELGGSEALSTGVEIAGSILPSAISKKLIPTGTSAKQITEAGRKIGLSESQITPLIQGEKKVATLSKVARKGTKTKELFESIKQSLGDSYNNIKKSVSNLGTVNAANQKILLDKFTDIKIDLSKTLKASPDKESAINFIGEAIDKLSENGASPEELINFWQDINKSVKWNSIQGGKKSLTRLKETISEVLHNVSPVAAKDFELTNQLYSKYAQISKKLKPDIVDTFINKGEILAIPAAGLALVHGNPWVLASLASENSLRLLGIEMLINPYFQNIANKLVKNFNQSSAKGVSDLIKQTKEYMTRKHPEEDWSFLDES